MQAEKSSSTVQRRPDSLQFDRTKFKQDFQPLDPSKIPRYLFRAFDRHSRGQTDENWVNSKDAVMGQPAPGEDVFQFEGLVAPKANIVSDHLLGKVTPTSNLVSWTSSLLVAIQYFFYRKQAYKPIPYRDCKICVVDTTAFPPNTFISDRDLIEVFAFCDRNLRQLQPKRNGEDHFGEFLSQGSLRVEGHSKVVDAGSMLEAGLCTIHDQLAYNLLDPVVHVEARILNMREQLVLDEIKRTVGVQKEAHIDAAVEVGWLFGPKFRLYAAAQLVALAQGSLDADTITRAFRKRRFRESEKMTAGSPVLLQLGPESVRTAEILEILNMEAPQLGV